ncbi:hypothetical protein [Roseomonas sp. AR75]|uniref:hypothetical protein n=1 Tax=Roseomonas sp. AR75 TaxID=2562311 RepID=UPI0019816FE1|nr:hypothetical protein [Roseomonas sp. AR75]
MDWQVDTDLPADATAGAPLDFRIALRGDALPPGAKVALVWHWPADWALEAPGALTVQADGVAAPWQRGRRADWHPFDHAAIASLPEGGRPVFIARGLGVQTFMEERAPLSLRIDPRGADSWTEVARLHLRVLGGAPHMLVATAPSDVAVGESFAVHLRVEDVWGNPARFPPMRVEIGGASGTIRAEEGAMLRLTLRLDAPGVHRLAARTETGLVAESNPILCHATPPAQRRRWGDIHAQSSIGCGARAIADYFRHARDFAAADFCSHQANCFMVTREEWAETEQVTRDLHEPGRYITLLGVEWSGVPAVGGDHNLYFPGDAAALHRCSHMLVPDKSDLDTDLPHITDVHRHYAGQDVLMAVHVGGRTSNLTWHAPALERLVEVHSTHATSEWMVEEAMRRGWRFGITGGSDGVDGRPAASHPGRHGVRNLRGGLTAVPLPELTRPALWDALRDGRTYGTNGPRILLDFARVGPARFRISAEGTAPIAAITLLRGSAAAARAALPPRDPAPSDWWRLRWWGAAGRGNWSQTRMTWDGEATVSGALLLDAKPWRWDTPSEGVARHDAAHVAWRSITAGSWDGVLLRLDEIAPGASLHVAAPPLSAELPLDSARVERVGGGDPASRLVLERLPILPAAPGWTGELEDPDPRDDQPHWLRVEQEDGGIAWSSPIWPAPP